MGIPAIIPVLLSLAGTAASMAGAAAAKRKMEATAMAELQRQGKYTGKANEAVGESIKKSGYDTATATAETGAANRLSQYDLATAAQPNASIASPAARFVPSGSAQATMQQSNAARSKLGGWQDWWVQSQQKDARVAQELGLLGQSAGASANVLPLEMQAAQHAGDTAQGVGSLLNTAGLLAGLSGALKAPTTPGVPRTSMVNYQAPNMLNPYAVSPYSSAFGVGAGYTFPKP